jgi:heptosyltransferase-1
VVVLVANLASFGLFWVLKLLAFNRLFHLELLRGFFNDSKSFAIQPTPLSITAEGRAFVQGLLLQPELTSKPRIMVCPGSKWQNKQLPLETMQTFLVKVADTFAPSFLLMWGSPDEKKYCQTLQESLPGRSLLIDKLPLPLWQNLMGEVDLLIAVDSSALHLAATTQTPSFSLFGPTAPSVFKPLGNRHFALQGPCPYNQSFTKQCPRLRTCSTGACIKNLGVNEIFDAFQGWWNREGPLALSQIDLSQ